MSDDVSLCHIPGRGGHPRRGHLEEDDFAFAADDFADDPGFLVPFGEKGDGPVGVSGRDGQGHTDAHIQGPEHLPLVDVAGPLDLPEYGRDGPGSFFDPDTVSLGDDPGDVVVEAAPGDMGMDLIRTFLRTSRMAVQ